VIKTQDAGRETLDTGQREENSGLESSVLSPVSLFRIFFIGDVIGHSGRAAVGNILPELKKELGGCGGVPLMVIANGENLAGGLGITQDTANELFSCGVDLLTTGNHVWDRKEILNYIDQDERILRPANYPKGVPGRGYTVMELEGKPPVAVFNLSGRVFMAPLDDPFVAADNIIPELREKANIIILDFHAEATSEKMAMGWYLDGQVSAVIGTHTHVQTADERILPAHTAYITDVGMTGPVDSIIGTKIDLIIQKFTTQMPVRFEVAKGDVMLSAVIIDVDQNTGRAISIKRLQRIVKR
jgi:metallophosphoesterase (TIGR00282 family)